jgi:hypothetical protein
MDNICYETLDKFNHVTPSFRRFVGYDAKIRNYEYHYDIAVKTFNTCEKTYLLNHFTAFKRNTSTNWRDIIFDYTNMVEHCINDEYTLNDVFNVFSLSPNNKANVHYLALLSENAIQDIINRNIVAFNKLNSYLNDLFLLKDMNLDA